MLSSACRSARNPSTRARSERRRNSISTIGDPKLEALVALHRQKGKFGTARAACATGYRVGFHGVTELIEARDERTPLRRRRQLVKLDLLMFNEYGDVPASDNTWWISCTVTHPVPTVRPPNRYLTDGTRDFIEIDARH